MSSVFYRYGIGGGKHCHTPILVLGRSLAHKADLAYSNTVRTAAKLSDLQYPILEYP